jgi:hypothetical protein
LQQTWPTLQVLSPQAALYGNVGPSQLRGEHASPGRAQIPQLALQQTWPTLQVLSPQATL